MSPYVSALYHDLSNDSKQIQFYNDSMILKKSLMLKQEIMRWIKRHKESL